MSPNTGQTDFYIYEKNEMNRDETGDIRIFADNNKMSEVTVSRLIAWPSDKEVLVLKHERIIFNYMNEQMDERYTLNYNTGIVKQVFSTFWC